jgi:hypothetical protein
LPRAPIKPPPEENNLEPKKRKRRKALAGPSKLKVHTDKEDSIKPTQKMALETNNFGRKILLLKKIEA